MKCCLASPSLFHWISYIAPETFSFNLLSAFEELFTHVCTALIFGSYAKATRCREERRAVNSVGRSVYATGNAKADAKMDAMGALVRLICSSVVPVSVSVSMLVRQREWVLCQQRRVPQSSDRQ